MRLCVTFNNSAKGIEEEQISVPSNTERHHRRRLVNCSEWDKTNLCEVALEDCDTINILLLLLLLLLLLTTGKGIVQLTSLTLRQGFTHSLPLLRLIQLWLKLHRSSRAAKAQLAIHTFTLLLLRLLLLRLYPSHTITLNFCTLRLSFNIPIMFSSSTFIILNWWCEWVDETVWGSSLSIKLTGTRRRTTAEEMCTVLCPESNWTLARRSRRI